MKKDTLGYEQALDAVVGILRDRARAGAAPLSYGGLSTELTRRGERACRRTCRVDDDPGR
ncbi:hypothetical protein ACH4ND_13315 [Streptomyces sp. NPDC017179]|uniref:hypothetical protein n=1 Tax=Streptomyces sp. NPDC017179 TaxID=3364979 RepID=UPI0037B3884A